MIHFLRTLSHYTKRFYTLGFIVSLVLLGLSFKFNLTTPEEKKIKIEDLFIKLNISSINSHIQSQMNLALISVIFRDQENFNKLTENIERLLSERSKNDGHSKNAILNQKIQERLQALRQNFIETEKLKLTLKDINIPLEDNARVTALNNKDLASQMLFIVEDLLRSELQSYKVARFATLFSSILLFGISLILAFQMHLSGLIEETEKLNRLLFSSIQEGLLLVQKDGTIATCNDLLAESLGLKKQDLIGRTVTRAIPKLYKSDRNPFVEFHPLLKITDSLSPIKNFIVGIKKSGQFQWFTLHSQPLTTEGQSSNSTIISFHDITALIEQQEKLEQQRLQMMATSKLSALGEMAAGIAHEINNPLAVIQFESENLVDLLKEENLEENKELATSTFKINKTVKRIAKIIKGLRTFSREGSKDPLFPEKIQTLVDETLDLCQQRINSRQIEIKKQIPEGLKVHCRATQISQVLLNLINNASDAIMPLNEKWISIQGRDLGDFVEISVTDSGAGLPESIKEKIFQPFFTTKDVGSGTGLGLSISKGIIDSHQGRLFIDETSKNTSFKIWLPKKTKA